MDIAIIGSRGIKDVDFSKYIKSGCTRIISGGAIGIDTAVAKYAKENGIELVEILPDYKTYGKIAPLIRNDKIISKADKVIAFWDGQSRGTKYVINKCFENNVYVNVVLIDKHLKK